MFHQIEYFDVYILCQAAEGLLTSGFEVTVNDFFESFREGYGDQNAYKKYSLLHAYCEWIIRQNMWNEDENIVCSVREKYEMRKQDAEIGWENVEEIIGTLWIDHALNYYHDTKYDFLKWVARESGKAVDQLSDTELEDFRYDYLHEIQEEDVFDSFLTQLSGEMFFVLFQNRSFLDSFNYRLATYNQQIKARIHTPKWAQRAVFYRDRGCCAFCGKDLSGTVRIPDDREIHYDHIVPLEDNGVNDISNLQLSCQDCNLTKNKDTETSSLYQLWYEFDSDMDIRDQ